MFIKCRLLNLGSVNSKFLIAQTAGDCPCWARFVYTAWLIKTTFIESLPGMQHTEKFDYKSLFIVCLKAIYFDRLTFEQSLQDFMS